MPVTTRRNSPGLAITLATAQNWMFAPGDTIHGSVLRSEPLLTSQARLTICLHGRAKAKLTRRGDLHGSETLRSQFCFFDTTSGRPAVTVHDGPLSVGAQLSESVSWDFDITIPVNTGVDHAAAARQRTCLIPITPDDLKRHKLPASFYAGSGGLSGSKFEGYVEYYLEAILRFSHGETSETTETVSSTQPISIRPPRVPVPITDWKLRIMQWNNTVASYRLLPGKESTTLSLKHTCQKFFNPSSVPKLTYNVEFGAPTCVQLNHPGWIPIMLRIWPNYEKTTNNLHGLPLKAVLSWVKVIVITDTTLTAATHWSARPKDASITDKFDLGLEQAFSLRPEPITLMVAENAPPVNVGAALQLRLDRNGLYSGDTRLAHIGPLTPSFTTYNLQHTHTFRYTFCITIAGTEFTALFYTPATLIARALYFAPKGG